MDPEPKADPEPEPDPDPCNSEVMDPDPGEKLITGKPDPEPKHCNAVNFLGNLSISLWRVVHFGIRVEVE